MNIKAILKPSILKVVIFSILGTVFLYFIAETACGIVLFYGFCYKAYGFPFSYLMTGDIEIAAGHIKTFFLGNIFIKYGKFLFNPLALILNIFLLYILSCLMALMFGYTKIYIKKRFQHS